MSGFPGSPRLLRGGIVLLDDRGAISRIVALQYNPDTVSRSLSPQVTEGEGLEAMRPRLKGPPAETIRLEAELDAADALEFPDRNGAVVSGGLHGAIAALEGLVSPGADSLVSADALLAAGTLEVAAPPAPLSLFVWGKERVVPVRITELSVTEEAFDPALNPIRAKVTLAMRVLGPAELGFGSAGGALAVANLRRKERLAQGAGRPEAEGEIAAIARGAGAR